MATYQASISLEVFRRSHQPNPL